MINLDYLFLSIKTDRPVAIGHSWVSDLVSEFYTRRFPKTQSNGEPNANANKSNNPHAYHYPRVQYKVIKGKPFIAAFNEGGPLLWELYDHLNGSDPCPQEWRILEKRIIEKKALFGLAEKSAKYRFLTPWLALPEESLNHYATTDSLSQEKILVKLLGGHIRDMAHSLGYEIPSRLQISIKVKPDFFLQKDIHVTGFLGSFYANFEIPDFLGLGKSVSRGYGAIKKIS